MLNSIQDKLRGEYKLNIKSQQIGPDINQSVLAWGNDINFNNYCYPDYRGVTLNHLPIVRVYKKNDFSLLSLIPFFSQSYMKYSEFQFNIVKDVYNKQADPNDDYWIQNLSVEDLDGDGADEIIVNAMSYLCASGGERYLFVLNNEEKNLHITSTLPSVGFIKGADRKVIELTDETNIKYNNEQAQITSAFSDTYIKFKDLDDDEKKELILGFPITGDELKGIDELKNVVGDISSECHLCGHTWLIGVYRFNGKEFLIDNSWNNGLLYITKNKINLGDALGYPYIEDNTFALLGKYYFDCGDFCDQFHNAGNKKSVILNIVEENYAKNKIAE